MIMALDIAKNECHNWRTTGRCSFGAKCKYTHTESLRNDRKEKFGQF